ncbi:Ribulose-phosphate 3-epimerase [Candidatus Ecksteinia adelgidicola]|nr:Ribulose-phosphate 3-epimerase [Candidatus Ecksteinia adelgidicola]
MKKFLIAPSILSADFARLGEDTKKVLMAGGDLIHFDVMDNHYVPNLTVGPIVCKALRNYNIIAPIDVHLMVKPVDCIISDFAKAGATCISFHPEASDHIDRTIQLIKDSGCKAGLAFNPSTSLSYLDYLIDKIDVILLMSVNPGFSNQLFINSTIKKIYQARQLIVKSHCNIQLEVDGGIKINNIANIASAGANIFVVGSEIFSTLNYRKVIDNLRQELKKITNNF